MKKDTVEELNAKLRFIVGVCLAFTLTGTLSGIMLSGSGSSKKKDEDAA